MAEEKLLSVYKDFYGGEPFVRICKPGAPLPSIRDVRGNNFCCIGFRLDKRTGTIVILSCIDNLVKGASGQAVQNMNIMTGLPETTGIKQTALHP